MRDQVFVIQVEGEEVWKVAVGGEIVAAEFRDRGAALAALEVERGRLERRQSR